MYVDVLKVIKGKYSAIKAWAEVFQAQVQKVYTIAIFNAPCNGMS